jgi:hypothetical protein
MQIKKSNVNDNEIENQEELLLTLDEYLAKRLLAELD